MIKREQMHRDNMKYILYVFCIYSFTNVFAFAHEIEPTCTYSTTVSSQLIFFPSAIKIKEYLDERGGFEHFYISSGAIDYDGTIRKDGWLSKIANSELTILQATIILQVAMLDHAGSNQNRIIAFDHHQRVIKVLFKKVPGAYELLYDMKQSKL